MIIDDNVQNPKWELIPCSCDHSSILTEFPLKDCIHCKCDLAEKSIPKNDFVIKDPETGDNLTITKIKVIRGSTYDDCIGWSY